MKNVKLRQLDIQLECVAAANIHDTWYFAANTVIITKSDITLVLNELGTPNANYEIINDRTPNLHAEMKIIRHLKCKKKINVLHKMLMGVSKPCCSKCKEILDKENVLYTSYHNSPANKIRWTPPY